MWRWGRLRRRIMGLVRHFALQANWASGHRDLFLVVENPFRGCRLFPATAPNQEIRPMTYADEPAGERKLEAPGPTTAMPPREDFWADTCRETTQMQHPSQEVL